MLIIPIRKEWYDMILSGEKKEEYREIKPYYERRLPINFGYVFDGAKLRTTYRSDPDIQKSVETSHRTEVMFRNGYGKDSPSFIAGCTLSVGTGKEEWGAVKDKEYFILTIHEILKGKRRHRNDEK